MRRSRRHGTALRSVSRVLRRRGPVWSSVEGRTRGSVLSATMMDRPVCGRGMGIGNTCCAHGGTLTSRRGERAGDADQQLRGMYIPYSAVEHLVRRQIRSRTTHAHDPNAHVSKLTKVAAETFVHHRKERLLRHISEGNVPHYKPSDSTAGNTMSSSGAAVVYWAAQGLGDYWLYGR